MGWLPPEGSDTEYGRTAAFRPAKKDPLLVRTVPVSGDVRRYRPSSARRDVLAGVTVAALALPSATGSRSTSACTSGASVRAARSIGCEKSNPTAR